MRCSLGKSLARGDNGGGQSNEELPLPCSWEHWALAAVLTWHCPPHSTATPTPPSSFWDSLRKFLHHRVRGKSTPVELQALGSPNITTLTLHSSWVPGSLLCHNGLRPPVCPQPKHLLLPRGESSVSWGSAQCYLAGGNPH